MTLDEIMQKLKASLSDSRFNHSVMVAKTSKELAERFGADVKKAYLAGLLHDCAKCLTDKELLEKINFYGIELDEDTLKSGALLHSFVGAFMAKDVYGTDDEEIFDAIYYHTIGKKEMPLLTKIVYLADAIEPKRNYPEVCTIREAAKTSLDDAIYMYTKASIDFVRKKGCYVHPNSIEVMDYYLHN